MNRYEAIAKTADQAIEEILAKLDCTIDQVDIEIYEESAKGLFGFLKSNQFRVVGTKKGSSTDTFDTVDTVEKTEKKAVEKAVISDNQSRNTKYGTGEAKIELSASELEARLNNAKSFLTQVLKDMNIKAEVDASVKNNAIALNIEGENMGIVIGKRGQTLDALQYLVSLVVNKNSSSYVRVIIDTENYREKRREALVRLANKLANKAVRYNKDMNLEPMNPYERRIIHSSLQGNKNVGTRSDGKEPYRRVVIYPRRYTE